MKKIIFIPLITILAVFSSCKNQDWSFSDYDYTTVYFAYQYPVRTIELGDDNVVDNSLDNAHKCQIMGTFGGAYSSKSSIQIGIKVDNSLCDGLSFVGGGAVMPMPSNYYTLSSNQITIPQGAVMGPVDVQLTDAFFADPLSIGTTYVIPLVMTSVQNADSILSGTPNVDNPNRVVASNWAVTPKDYILYAVKYINPWDANYLRRGTDVITKDGTTNTVVRHAQYVENDEVIKLTTKSMSQIVYPLSYQDNGNNNVYYNLLLTFDNTGKCTVSSGSDNVTATGNGQFVEKGEKNSWGNQDRNALYLSYTVNFADRSYATTDTLVVRDRGIGLETFDVVHN